MKQKRLSDFFKENKKVALAFSGGTDSAYLMYAAVSCGAEIGAYYVCSPLQPRFELVDAQVLARQLGVTLRILKVDLLQDPLIADNPKNRCYYCKKRILSHIWQAARKDGFSVLIDGTNASDLEKERPGMKALEAYAVRSPLRECGLSKEKIRNLSREAGLFTWDKPAYACLATRISVGSRITLQTLEKIELAEDFLFSLGLRDFRVRVHENSARLQVLEKDLDYIIKNRNVIRDELMKYFDMVVLDLEVRE